MSRKENVSGNTDEKEKARKLSKDEQKRLEQFETLAENMREKGYRRTDLTISIVKAWFGRPSVTTSLCTRVSSWERWKVSQYPLPH